MSLAGWTPGHRPTRLLELASGNYVIVWTRHHMPDVHQTVTATELERFRARRTLPPPEPATEEDLAA